MIKSGDELSLEELEAMIEKKKQPENSSSTEDTVEETTKVIDGVEYNYDPSTNMIMDPSDMTEMGEWDEDDNSISFEDEECEEKHQSYVKAL